VQLGSGSKLGGGSENALKADINVTPLVDVCLVLLIIFMVITPMLMKGVDVALPETNNPEKMPESAKQLDITIKADNTVFIGQKWVPDDQLLAQLKDIHERTPDKVVVVKGDRRIKYAQVRKVMKLINQSGFSGVGLVFHKKGQGS
jgi:biopolymer transport protein TolR